MMTLKPPAVPSPGIGDVPNTLIWASPSFGEAAHALLSVAMIAVSRSSGLWRSLNGSRTMNIDAKLELLAWSRNDMPPMPTVCATPRLLLPSESRRAIRSTSFRAAWVCSSDHESGSWTLTMRRPWSCCGMKPVGAF